MFSDVDVVPEGVVASFTTPELLVTVIGMPAAPAVWPFGSVTVNSDARFWPIACPLSEMSPAVKSSGFEPVMMVPTTLAEVKPLALAVTVVFPTATRFRLVEAVLLAPLIVMGDD